jgi:hypothetical protein
MNNVDRPPRFGLRLGSDSMVEICLDEDVALEEQEKADNRRIDELVGWTAKNKSYSPYPLPFHPPIPPAKDGEDGKQWSINEMSEEKSRWSGGI